MWRVCHNSLPIRDNLRKRKITIDPICPLCGLFPKTIGHVLWSCAAATVVWMECNRKIQKLSILENDGFLLFEQWMVHLDNEDLELVVFIARRLWLQRDTVVFGGKLLDPFHVLQKRQDSLEVFRETIQCADSCVKGRPAPNQIVWKKPAVGVVKTN